METNKRILQTYGKNSSQQFSIQITDPSWHFATKSKERLSINNTAEDTAISDQIIIGRNHCKKHGHYEAAYRIKSVKAAEVRSS